MKLNDSAHTQTQIVAFLNKIEHFAYAFTLQIRRYCSRHIFSVENRFNLIGLITSIYLWTTLYL